jgi:hypothetical protein
MQKHFSQSPWQGGIAPLAQRPARIDREVRSGDFPERRKGRKENQEQIRVFFALLCGFAALREISSPAGAYV